MMRSQQALAYRRGRAICRAHHYDQIFSPDATIMIFFAAMPIMIGLMNSRSRCSSGVRDVGLSAR